VVTPPATVSATEEYDGSTWTTSPGSLKRQDILAGCGSQTAGLAFGGRAPPVYSSNRRMDRCWSTTTKTITVS
jgi:hypothetical protein